MLSLNSLKRHSIQRWVGGVAKPESYTVCACVTSHALSKNIFREGNFSVGECLRVGGRERVCMGSS